jgi:molecular chaperone GrpE
MGRKKRNGNGEAPPNGGNEDAPQQKGRVVDKRRFARLLGFGGADEGEAGGEVRADERDLPAFVEQMKQRVEEAQEAARGEIEAARSRLERHYEERLASERAGIASSLLDVFDNLERALEVPGAAESPLYEGVAATRDMFLRRLADLGVEPVPGVGEPFDPEIHEAIDQVEADDPAQAGRIVDQFKRGFRTAERLVRPAVVRIAKSAEEHTETVPEAVATGSIPGDSEDL